MNEKLFYSRLDILLPKFKKGEELYNTSPIFNTIIHQMIINDLDVYEALEEVILMNERTQEAFEDHIKKSPNPVILHLDIDLIKIFENAVESELHKNIWKSLDEITEMVGYNVEWFSIIKYNENFIQNSKGKITTIKLYKKYTSFLRRCNDTLNGTIL